MPGLTMSVVFIATLYFYFSIYHQCRKSTRESFNSSQAKAFRNVRLAKSCAIVVVCSLVCYLPYVVVRSVHVNNAFTLLVGFWSKTLILGTHSLNSLVFFWRNKARDVAIGGV